MGSRRQVAKALEYMTNTMKDLGVVAILLSVEFFDVIVYTVSKAAMKKGMNDFVFVMYSNA